MGLIHGFIKTIQKLQILPKWQPVELLFFEASSESESVPIDPNVKMSSFTPERF